MLKADAKHFDEIAYNVTQMQQDCIVMLSELRECIIINESLYRRYKKSRQDRFYTSLSSIVT